MAGLGSSSLSWREARGSHFSGINSPEGPLFLFSCFIAKVTHEKIGQKDLDQITIMLLPGFPPRRKPESQAVSR